ncbi:hypothetical protein ACLKA6_004008 [Drosophila palustris]
MKPLDFAVRFREHMRMIRPVPAAHHSQRSMFIHKNLADCSHVFLRTDAVRQPLEPPYTGPYKVVKRSTDRVFVIEMDGKEVAVSTERLKPAFILNESGDDTPANNNKPLRTYERKKQTISLPTRSLEGG